MTEQWIDVEQARALILAGLPGPTPAEQVALHAAIGRTLYAPQRAPLSLPDQDTSSMDGYAVRWRDVARAALPLAMPVTAHIAAGDAPTAHKPESASRIMTGAPLPAGADTVIMRELWDEGGATSTLKALPDAGQGAAVRRAGSFAAMGQEVLRAGLTLGPGELALLAELGLTSAPVHARPVVAIVSTGDELVEPGAPRAPGQRVNTNALMLAALARAHGAEPWVLPTAPDDLDAIKASLRCAALRADLIVTSGGASVGDHDLVKPAMEALCGALTFWKIRMRPGKPLVFATTLDHARPLIGLPGNPAAAFVCFHQFLRPALALLGGAGAPPPLPTLYATLTADTPSTAARRHYVTGHVSLRAEGATFTPIPSQDSGNLLILSGVNALGVIDEGVASMPAGASIRVELL